MRTLALALLCVAAMGLAGGATWARLLPAAADSARGAAAGAAALAAGPAGGTAARAPARAAGPGCPPACGPDPVLDNTRYGYRLRYPEGWQAEDLTGVAGTGRLAESAEVLLYPDPARKLDVAMGARICPSTGPAALACLPSGGEITGRRQVTVAGRTATQVDMRRAMPRENQTWLERHTLVEHAGRTYHLWAAWPTAGPWPRVVREAYAGLLRSFTFTR